MVSPNVPRAINRTPQPDAGHAQPAPAIVEADTWGLAVVENWGSAGLLTGPTKPG